MPMQRIVVATTNPINGVILPRESMEGAATVINGDKATRHGLEHDPHYVPLGKVREAEVMDLEEETVISAIIDDSHSATPIIHEPTGNGLVEITFPNDKRPFILYSEQSFKATLTVTVDNVNFDNGENFQAFLNAADKEKDAEATSLIARRSLTPEPFIQFLLNDIEIKVVLTWIVLRGEKFLRYTVDETTRKVGDVISDKISETLKRWLGTYNGLRSQDDREVTSQITINMEPQINLLTKGQETEQNTELSIESLCRQMELHQDLLEAADSVTFGRSSKDEEWKFLYIITKSGNVIATEDCYLATLEKVEDIAMTRPFCLCLEHKTTKEERHYETTAVVTLLDDDGNVQLKFNSFPKDIGEWELTSISLLTSKRTEQ